jgi:hypothetical protein
MDHRARFPAAILSWLPLAQNSASEMIIRIIAPVMGRMWV